MRINSQLPKFIALGVLGFSLAACESTGTNTTGSSGGSAGTGGDGGSGQGGMGTGGIGTGGMGTGGMGTGGMGQGGSAAVACPGLEALIEPPEQLYVAPGGDDAAAGTKNAPLATLGAAAKRFPMGGTIIVRGGEYPHQVVSNAKGTVDHPLVIRAETGETPIFDGTAQTVDYRGTLLLTNAENVTLVGLEVRNATGATHAAAISANGPVKNVRIRDCHLHHINGPIARFNGDGIIIEGNHMHDGALMNSVDHSNNWPTCVGTSPNQNNPMDPWAKNIIIRNNHVHDCWGEGIALFFGTKALVEGNIIERTWNVGIYMDNASDVTVTRNFVHMVNGMALNSGAGSPILIGMEEYDMWGVAYQPTRNIVITNNVTYGRSGVGWFFEPNASPNIYYDDFTIAHNTFFAATAGIRLSTVQAGKPKPKNLVIQNNVIIEKNASTPAADFPEAYHLSGNAWISEALPPIAGADDVSIMGLTVTEPANATDMQSLVSVVGNAATSANVPIDYLCATRSSTTPVRGAFEK